MPGLILTLSGADNAGLSRKIAEELTDLTCAVLDKEPGRTWVTVRFIPPDQWFIGKTPLTAHGKQAFRLELTITDGTNTNRQKAAYHRQAFDLLSRLIGDVHPHSNIHIVDCKATGYGYGGVTQEWHYQRLPGPTPSPSRHAPRV